VYVDLDKYVDICVCRFGYVHMYIFVYVDLDMYVDICMYDMCACM